MFWTFDSCTIKYRPCNPPIPFMEKSMKQLLTLTLVAMLGFAIIGCNKTEKVNASATTAQCGGADCDPANCDISKCNKTAANCALQGTTECPMAAAAAKAKPAAAGDSSKCCSSKTKAKPAAAGDSSKCCSSKAKAKPAAAGDANCNPSGCNKAKNAGCPMANGK